MATGEGAIGKVEARMVKGEVNPADVATKPKNVDTLANLLGKVGGIGKEGRREGQKKRALKIDRPRA